nr:hypothetical protein [Tanacetum cinerariifolium]
SSSHRCLEVTGVARAQLVAFEQDEHVGDLEIFIPARLAADLGAQTHVGLEQRGHFADHVVRNIERRQRVLRLGAQMFGAQVAFTQTLHDGVSLNAAVLHWNAGAAHQ